MSFKLNLGAGIGWRHPDWLVMDHRVTRRPDWLRMGSKIGRRGSAWSIPLPSESCSAVFTSHMIEHIPSYKIDKVFSEINRVLKVGGIVRILTPDLCKLSEAYVKHNTDFLEKAREEDASSIRTDLGAGGIFMGFIVSHGSDSYLFDRNITELIGGYAHLGLYDEQMLKNILEKHGFGNIVRRKFCESALPELEEPYHIEGLEAVWHTQTNEYLAEARERILIETGTRQYMLTGFDRNPLTSLIMEATKLSSVTQDDHQDIVAESSDLWQRLTSSSTSFKIKSLCFALISLIINFAFDILRMVFWLVGRIRKYAAFWDR